MTDLNIEYFQTLEERLEKRIDDGFDRVEKRIGEYRIEMSETRSDLKAFATWKAQIDVAMEASRGREQLLIQELSGTRTKIASQEQDLRSLAVRYEQLKLEMATEMAKAAVKWSLIGVGGSALVSIGVGLIGHFLV